VWGPIAPPQRWNEEAVSQLRARQSGRFRRCARLASPHHRHGGKGLYVRSYFPARSFRSGEVIFRQGDGVGTEAYLVHRGRVEVRRTIAGEERVLGILESANS
jgi:cyclic nucleotide-binding protein